MRLLHLFTVHDGQIFKEREVEIAWLAGRPINDIHTIIGLRKPEFEPGKQAVETKTVKFLRKL